ncbi:hypothetical protein HPB51_018542 [Rhipicephalus microplus]|uniref:Phospholipase A2-like domain-containing protein n=1 Tax=Rhipicephalus microplus TaxID=6941 RepID=A0A9J6DHX7_RHIMP|nr:hypothetical protein HPB51_018542 [Rhipicephalus microplus]
MPLFSGHRYLGPGNPLRNGDPVDEDDGLAKSHDEAYDLYGIPGAKRKRAHNGQSDTADAKRYQPDSSTGDARMSAQMQSDTPVRPDRAGIGGMCRVKKGETNNPMKPQSYTPFQEKDHADLAKSYWGLKITPGNEEQNGDDEKSMPACMGVPRHNFAYDLFTLTRLVSA